MNFGIALFLLSRDAVSLPTGWQVEMVGVTNGEGYQWLRLQMVRLPMVRVTNGWAIDG